MFRYSNIEFLPIIAMLMTVIGHLYKFMNMSCNRFCIPIFYSTYLSWSIGCARITDLVERKIHSIQIL